MTASSNLPLKWRAMPLHLLPRLCLVGDFIRTYLYVLLLLEVAMAVLEVLESFAFTFE